jgi:nucleotide-binding universal stress UspA family protein
MSFEGMNYSSARQDFTEARLKANMQEALAFLTGKTNELLSYDEVAKKLKLSSRSDRGIQNIPLDAIVGSVGRYTDFTRSFLPRRNSDRDRWAGVKAAVENPAGTGLPPIDVYKVGEAYFVLDGNHRVSIARQQDSATIEAHVVEVKTDVPVTPDIQPDDLIIKAEYVEFLEKTEIQDLRPNVDLSVTVPGQYPKLLEHIEVHRYYMGIDLQRDISYPEAVAHWYDNVYLMFIEPIRERGLLRWFPDRTETDLYLWVSEHRSMLENELDWTIRPEIALEDLASKANPRAASEETKTGSWRTTRLMDRYTDRLFNEILVPMDGTEAGWCGLEQAIVIAERESGNLNGLHVVDSDAEIQNPQAAEMQARFNQRCQESGISGNMAVKAGEVPEQIRAHALLSDLIVLNVSHPPGRGLSSLGSGLRAVIRSSPRPILTVPGKVSALDRALVACDGSEKSKEALFLATYLAECWKIALTVATIQDNPTLNESVQEYARSYLELHEIQAEFLFRAGSMEDFLDIIKEEESNLVVMGSYGGTGFKEVVIGSAVNFLLRQADCPIFICR